jgi:hypothetical protein
MKKGVLDAEFQRDRQTGIIIIIKVKQSLYTPWRRLGEEEV